MQTHLFSLSAYLEMRILGKQFETGMSIVKAIGTDKRIAHQQRSKALTARFLLISDEWDELCRWLLRAEIELFLFVAFGMLLTPKFQEERRHGRKHRLCAVNLGMAARAQRKHQAQNRPAGYPVVDDDGPLVTTGSITDATTVAVTLQNRFAQPTEILLILPFQGIAGRAQSQRQHLCVSAWAVHHPLSETCHFPAPLFVSAALALTARSIVWTETPK